MAAQDVEGLLDLFTDDFHQIDHRPFVGGDRQGRPVAAVRVVARWSIRPCSQIDEMLACDDRGIAATRTLRGRRQQRRQ
jgi:hypothetical protein